MNLTPKHNPEEFNRFLFDEVDLGLFQHKFLKDFIGKAQDGQSTLYDTSIININEYGWILVIYGEMFFSEILLVYGYNWSTNQLQEISEIFDLQKNTNYKISGEEKLINELIKFYKPKKNVTEKRRLLYKTEKVNVFENDNLKIRLGTLNHLDELALMLQGYYNEEYNGLYVKEITDIQKRMFLFIQAEKVYVLLNTNDELVSFCTIIDPDIGILFTKNEYRNMGFGKVILSYCSNLLQHKNGEVYVMTDREKPESNRVCAKVGFEPFYEYKMIKINCG